MIQPKCPYCGEELEYDFSTDTWYDENSYHVKWNGFCNACNLDFQWQEVFKLEKIIGPTLVKDNK